MPSYEYPFNERIRTWLRLEDLFDKAIFDIASPHPITHHTALVTIFQILDVIDRAELKTDLIQELDRQKNYMSGLAGNPSISENALNEILVEIENAAQQLRAQHVKLGQPLRDNEWLMGIKQRAIIPGGVCEFDLPSYHYWLRLSEDRRREDLHAWLDTLMPIHTAILIILRILRGSASVSQQTAINGSFQQFLSGAKPAQMVVIVLDEERPCFPEVSANKHVINVRFHYLVQSEKPRPCDEDISFALRLCNL